MGRVGCGGVGPGHDARIGGAKWRSHRDGDRCIRVWGAGPERITLRRGSQGCRAIGHKDTVRDGPGGAKPGGSIEQVGERAAAAAARACRARRQRPEVSAQIAEIQSAIRIGGLAEERIGGRHRKDDEARRLIEHIESARKTDLLGRGNQQQIARRCQGGEHEAAVGWMKQPPGSSGGRIERRHQTAESIDRLGASDKQRVVCKRGADDVAQAHVGVAEVPADLVAPDDAGGEVVAVERIDESILVRRRDQVRAGGRIEDGRRGAKIDVLIEGARGRVEGGKGIEGLHRNRVNRDKGIGRWLLRRRQVGRDGAGGEKHPIGS